MSKIFCEVIIINTDKLINLLDITVNQFDPKDKKMNDYIIAIKNPYEFKVGDIVVNVSFDDTEITFQKAIENLISINLEK